MKQFLKVAAGIVLVWLAASAAWSTLSAYVAKSAIMSVDRRE